LRLVRPALRYFASFATTSTSLTLPALEYLAQANQQRQNREYWLVDGVRCRGNVVIHLPPQGRKAAIATHIELSCIDSIAEATLIKLTVRKACKLGINPVLLSCDATDYVRRENIERSGGVLINTVRERVAAHSGKVRVYSFSAPPLFLSSSQRVLGDAGEIGKDLARGLESQTFPRPAI
jgi:hypothetical protein